MGIIYNTLVDLILESNGEKNVEELKKIAIDRFGFTDNKKLSSKIEISLIIGKACGNYKLLKDGKYSWIKGDGEDRKFLLSCLTGTQDKYFKAKPYIEKLKEALGKNI